MALFRRRRSTASGSAVAVDEFWSHWSDVRDALAASVTQGTPVPEEAAARLTERVRQIHPALTWEVSAASRSTPGDLGDLGLPDDAEAGDLLARMSELDDPETASANADPMYALTLSSGPDDSARILAERWARTAPTDSEWRFNPARPTDHEKLTKSLTWEDNELDLAHCTTSMRVDQQQGKIHAGVYHPDFMFLPEEVQAGVADHVVLLALGEDDCVRWISDVEPLVEKPLDPLPPTSMPSVVHQLAEALAGGGWATLQGRIPLRGTLEISARHPLHRRDFPACTLYVQVTVGYANSDDDRLPTEPSVSALQSFTSRLRELLGDNGALLAQQTVGGQRQLHFYLDPDSGVLPDLEAAVREWSEGRSNVHSALDPEWKAITQIKKPFVRKLGG
ncbi:hypothetical protein F4561_004470 [Lipingzhangella halophila]|uniref:DUF695 domain-containing protein n=1 Tax=Lipingzhangella halophila TaxID=1783352 RepID=A0A7W7RKK3_9ACTN|nr:DUF695 domain-containing protein [Lipingzhangella halophila]MBB4933650.1 hypothetical protein [Lipingzhangella halophila]